jgi:signal transduction histidine kinase
VVRSGKKSLRLSADEAAAVIVHLSRQLEGERAGIARRLHSDVAGMLAAARMDLSRLATRGADDVELVEQLHRVDRLLEQVIRDARAEMQRLHPALLDHFGLPAAVRHRVEEVSRGCAAEFSIELPEMVEALAPDIALAAYRVVEALLRGPGLRRIDVRLRAAESMHLFDLEVERDGIPDAATQDDLRALKAWLESLGAKWSESRRDGHFRLALRLPQAT